MPKGTYAKKKELAILRKWKYGQLLSKLQQEQRVVYSIHEMDVPEKVFFARDTAALLLDCAVAHSVELA